MFKVHALLAVAAGMAVNGLPGSIPVSDNKFVVYGDSISVGIYQEIPQYSWPYLVRDDLGISLSNFFMRAISARMMCSINTNDVFPVDNPSSQHSQITALMAGTNDAINKGAGSYEPVFEACHMGILSWEALGQMNKVMASSATPTGFAADSFYRTGIGMSSTANGATLTFSLTTYGQPAYIWYQAADSNGGTFTYTVDGGNPSATVNCFGPVTIGFGGGFSSAVFVQRITGLSAGTHSIVITVTSPTSASNKVLILAVGASPGIVPLQPRYQSPAVFAAGVPMPSGGNSAATTAYNNDAKTDIATLYGDGLPVFLVDVQEYWNGLANEYATTVGGTSGPPGAVHPSDFGATRIRDAFEAVMQAAPAAKPLNVWDLDTYTTSQTLTNDDQFVYVQGNSITLTLPPSPVNGQMVYIRNSGGASGNLTVAANTTVNAQTIVGPQFGHTMELGLNGSALLIFSTNGANSFDWLPLFYQPAILGAVAEAIRFVSTATNTATTADSFIGLNGSVAQTETLPATPVPGERIVILNTGANNATVQANSGQTIAGGSVTLPQNNSVTLYYNSTKWYVTNLSTNAGH